MRDSLRRATMAIAIVCGLASGRLFAQLELTGREQLEFDRPEAWAMQYAASSTLSSALGSPRPLSAGEFEIALEYSQVPSLTESQRTVGFGGVKVEDLNKVPYVLRPHVEIGLGRRLTLGIGYLPPVERNNTQPNLWTLSLGRPMLQHQSWRLGLRLHSQIGTIEGDLTCSAQTVAAGDNPEANPFGCTAVSNDELEIATLGLELSTAVQIGPQYRWEPFAAVSVQRMDLEFRVGAEYSGLVDRSRLVTDGTTWSTTAGVGIRLSDRWRLAAAIFYSPLEVARPPSTSTQTDELVNLRALLSYRIR